MPVREVIANAASIASDTATAVIIMRLNTAFASVEASRHSTGSRNLPIGSQPAWNANSQIIISANHGVNTVYSVTPPSVAPYSVQPPLRHAIILPSPKPR